MLEVNRDVTRRRQLEQQAQAAHTESLARLELLQQLLDALPSGVYLVHGRQARLFGRFVRADNARATEIAGTGLGLYLSRELVERHGGQLWFESREGTGSTFYLTLPLL